MATEWTGELEQRLDGWWDDMLDNGWMGNKLIHCWSASMWVHEMDLWWGIAMLDGWWENMLDND